MLQLNNHRKEGLQRPIIAGRLLLLYLFIATPVRLWHHHQHGSSAVRCEVCSHQYTPYTDTAYRLPDIICLRFHPEYVLQMHGYTTRPLQSYSNKGPPYLILLL